ncbi:MAG: phosphoribosyl-ATP diphosphatase [Eubacteriales bacterium]|nr:phosphoribosyl-ATP diphosphatase [Eubacteriales bacterium]
MAATAKILEELYQLTVERDKDPVAGSYTNYLLDKGSDRILLKLGEQCLSLILATKNEEDEQLKNELADLLYHLTVLLYTRGLDWQEIYEELEKRRRENA